MVSGVKRRGAGMTGGGGGGGGGGGAAADLLGGGGALAADGPSRAHLRAFARDALSGSRGAGGGGGGGGGAGGGTNASALAFLGAKESALLAELRDAL